MFEAGLVHEVRELMKFDPPIGRTAAQGLGYKEVIDGLDGDSDHELTTEERAAIVELIQTRTRQFAKRQHTWYRNLEECVEVQVASDDSPVQVGDRLEQLVAQRSKASDNAGESG
jgi:tRNA dimethylallyltransferase